MIIKCKSVFLLYNVYYAYAQKDIEEIRNNLYFKNNIQINKTQDESCESARNLSTWPHNLESFIFIKKIIK